MSGIWQYCYSFSKLDQVNNVHNFKLNNAKGIFAQPLTKILDLTLLSFILFIAASTILLMIGLLLSSKFSVIASLIFLSAILIGASIVYAAIKSSIFTKLKGNQYCLWGILILSLSGAILSISINRPDIDDSIYVPKAVFYTENPKALIDKSVTWIAVPDNLPTTGVFPYYELSQAAFSLILEKKYLDFYHIIFPGIVGFLICLSMFLLIRIFEHKQSAALLSVLFFILLLMSLGETHRTFGNLSFARAFQGKFMFLSVGVTSWVYFSLRYFLMRDLLSWIALIALGIGMAGATTTAMVFLPFLSIAIIASYYFNESRTVLSISDLKLATTYFASLIPLVAMAIDFRSYAINHIGAGSSINAGFPKSFSEQMRLLINPDYPLMPTIFILTLVFVIFFSRYRKFFISWVAIIIVFLLNPLVSDFVIKNITTENIYWRLFYLLPFPLVACVAFSILVQANQVSKTIAVFLMALLIQAAFWGPTSVVRPGNRATIDFHGYKIGSRDPFAVSQKIIDTIAYGSMFSPIELSNNILLLSSRYPQFYMREDYLGFMLGSVGHSQEFKKRAKTYSYLYNEDISDDGKLSFLNIIKDKNKPNHIVVRSKSINYKVILQMLRQEGYEARFFIDDRYEIFSVTKDRKS